MSALTSPYAYKMKSRAIVFIAISLSILLNGCSSEPPTPTAVSVYPSTQDRVQRSPYYLPMPNQWTVGDVLQVYGKNAADKLGYYFTKAKVAYPQKEWWMWKPLWEQIISFGRLRANTGMTS